MLAALEARVEGAVVVGVSAEDPLVDGSTADLLTEFAPGVPVRRRIGPRESLVDTTRARTLLGFTPATPSTARTTTTTRPSRCPTKELSVPDSPTAHGADRPSPIRN